MKSKKQIFKLDDSGNVGLPYIHREQLFEEMSEKIHAKISSLETMPFQVPECFFSNLADRLVQNANQTFVLAYYQSKPVAYSNVTEEYFENAQQKILDATCRSTRHSQPQFLGFNLSPQVLAIGLSVFVFFNLVLLYGLITKFDTHSEEQCAVLNKADVKSYLLDNYDEIDLQSLGNQIESNPSDFIQIEKLSEIEKENLILDNISSF